jgi:hypothetical protein
VMERVLEENKTALSGLIDQVRRRGIVPFIGAGMSAPFYPLWSRFLLDQAKDQRILTKIRDLLRRDQYEQAAESLLGRLKEHRFHDIVRNTFGPVKLPQRNDVPDALRYVAALGQGPVLTLNFDPMLEFVFREFGAAFEREVWGAEVDTFNETLDLNLHYLLKVHGHAPTMKAGTAVKETTAHHKTPCSPGCSRELLSAAACSFLDAA